MLFRICFFTIFLIYLVVLDKLAKSEEYNSLKSKNLYRPTRSNSKTNNEEFEKFFLKASKSVPRIGRRGSVNDNYYPENSFLSVKYPYYGTQPKRALNKFGSPLWNDIAQIYEYNPDLPNLMEYMSAYEQEQGDDPSVYNFEKMKFKRKNLPAFGIPNKEIMEYRIQADG